MNAPVFQLEAAEPVTLALDEVVLDPALLLRPLDEATAQDYADCLRRKVKLPPIVVMRLPDRTHVCIDGQHRHAAHRLAKRERIEVLIMEGDRAAATLASASSNISHGKQRSAEHKRAAVEALCKEPFYADKSNRWIASACCVSPTLVGEIRPTVQADSSASTVQADSSEEPKATIGKDGKSRKKPKRKPFDAAKQGRHEPCPP